MVGWKRGLGGKRQAAMAGKISSVPRACPPATRQQQQLRSPHHQPSVAATIPSSRQRPFLSSFSSTYRSTSCRAGHLGGAPIRPPLAATCISIRPSDQQNAQHQFSTHERLGFHIFYDPK